MRRQVHLEAILPAVLGGLADEAEGVRSAALAAGRTLVDLYALSALELLLPAILLGTAHRNWRIRQSSIELLGDLLFKACRRPPPATCRRLGCLALHPTACMLSPVGTHSCPACTCIREDPHRIASKMCIANVVRANEQKHLGAACTLTIRGTCDHPQHKPMPMRAFLRSILTSDDSSIVHSCCVLLRHVLVASSTRPWRL